MKAAIPVNESRPKKIMHLIATNFYGGPEKQILQHLVRLNKDRFQGMLVSFIEGDTKNEILEEAESQGIQHHGIPMSGPVDFRALWHLLNILQTAQVDLLCTHGYKATVMGALAGRLKKVPVIAFSRGYTAEDRKVAFYESLERRALEHVHGIVAVSNGQATRLRDLGVRNRRVWVVHNSVSTNGDCQEYGTHRRAVFDRFGIKSSSRLVVSAGRLSPEKGHQYLVQAIAAMNGNMGNAIFLFCGEGPCKDELERKARDLGIAKRCRFVGFRRDLQQIFSAMDLLVLPSLTEGLPNVVLEAFACAKPVVATSVGGVPEVVQDAKNGFLVPPRNPRALATAISKVLSMGEHLQNMGKYGYDNIKSDFSFEVQARKLESIYDDILLSKETGSDGKA